MTFENTPYEVQVEQFFKGRTYPVRITPIPTKTWRLQILNHRFRPILRFWAIVTVRDNTNPSGNSSWTLLFAFREPPMDHLERTYHDGLVMFLRDDIGPHHFFVSGFTFDLFVGPSGTIARGEILSGCPTDCNS